MIFSCFFRRVPVKLIGAEVPKATGMKVMPRHKKNADIGTKETFFADSMFLEQEDALSFAENEEVGYKVLQDLLSSG